MCGFYMQLTMILCRDNSDPPKSISNGAMVILRKGETETPRTCSVVRVPKFRPLNRSALQ